MRGILCALRIDTARGVSYSGLEASEHSQLRQLGGWGAVSFHNSVRAGPGSRRMNLPTTLTILRIFVVPLLVVLMLTKEENMDLWAVGVFLGAAFTDALDGYLARKHGQVTTLGILLDPIADKLLTSAAFISLVELGRIPAWMVAIVIGREFAVSGLRAVASSKGFAIAASDLGKAKMVFQVMAITALVLDRRFPILNAPGDFLMWVVVVFALASALQYFWGFWRKVDLRARREPGQPMMVLRVGEKEEEKDVPAQ